MYIPSVWRYGKGKRRINNAILFGTGIQAALSTAGAAAMLVFSLLYTPCIAAIASVKRELGGKWAVIMVVWQCLIAWVMAFVVHAVVMLF